MEITQSDETLMLEVKNGDLAGASVLFDRYHKHLYNFLVKLTGRRDLGEDLTQNVFLRMIKYRHTYQSDSTFKSWIFRIARNVHADYYQKNKKSRQVGLESIKVEPEHIDDILIKNDQEKLLYLALYRLKPEYKEILLLSKFEKMKYEEIARVYETTVPAIKSKVHRAMGQLREVYFEMEKL